jgi:hypothetical protein
MLILADKLGKLSWFHYHPARLCAAGRILSSLVFEHGFRGFIREGAGFSLLDGVLLLEIGAFLLSTRSPTSDRSSPP